MVDKQDILQNIANKLGARAEFLHSLYRSWPKMKMLQRVAHSQPHIMLLSSVQRQGRPTPRAKMLNCAPSPTANA